MGNSTLQYLNDENLDLRDLFGEGLSADHERGLKQRLAVFDDLVRNMAGPVTKGLGVAYSYSPLNIVAGGRSVNLDGGLSSNDGGDIWFTVEFDASNRPPPWELGVQVTVFCDRQTPGGSCTHPVYEHHRSADNPDALLDAMEEEVRLLKTALLGMSMHEIVGRSHDELETSGRPSPAG